jgi:hypothetical protein
MKWLKALNKSVRRNGHANIAIFMSVCRLFYDAASIKTRGEQTL